MQPIQPLYKLLNKETEFKRTNEHQQIFEKMKQTIIKNLEITMLDTSEPFYIITDASNTGIRAALLPQHPTENKTNLISANLRLFALIKNEIFNPHQRMFGSYICTDRIRIPPHIIKNIQ